MLEDLKLQAIEQTIELSPAKSIKDLRLRMGWSRNELAAKLHCSCEDVLAFELAGQALPSAVLGELIVLSNRATEIFDDVRITPFIDAALISTELAQINFSEFKAEFE